MTAKERAEQAARECATNEANTCCEACAEVAITAAVDAERERCVDRVKGRLYVWDHKPNCACEHCLCNAIVLQCIEAIKEPK